MPIIKLSGEIRKQPVGAEVTVIADDKGFPPDLRAWCQKTGQELLSLDDTDAARLVGVVRRVK
jgi:TusA-related sulfurtransferase